MKIHHLQTYRSMGIWRVCLPSWIVERVGEEDEGEEKSGSRSIYLKFRAVTVSSNTLSGVYVFTY
jgi:hypothetical protein